MTQVNIADAKEHFSDWIELLLSGQQDEILVINDGGRNIKMTLDDTPAAKRKPGLGKGKFTFDDELFDKLDAEIADMFEASVIFSEESAQ